jgi:hypothetical protein
LFVITLMLMGLAHWIEPDLDARVGAQVGTTTREVAIVEPAGRLPSYTVRQANEITLIDHLSERFGRAWADLTDDASLRPLIDAALWGGAASAVVLLVFGGFTHLNKTWPTTWSPGESSEERFDRVLLRVAAAIVTLFIVIGCWPLPAMKTNGRVGCLAGPAIVLAGTCIMNFALYTFMARMDAGPESHLDLWSRKFRSLWGSFTAFAVYALGAALLFACLPIVAYAVEAAMDRETSLWSLVAPIVSLVTGRLLVGSDGAGARRLRLPTGVKHFLLGVIVCVFVGFVLIAFGALGVHHEFMKPAGAPFTYWFWLAGAIGAALLLSLVGNINRISPHYFYRDRLIETYLRTEAGDKHGQMRTFANKMELKLTALHGADPESGIGNSAPYLLISAAINLSGSRDLTRKDRKSAHFLFSKYYCGSRQTGYRKTDHYRGGKTKLGGAMTVSGAAASSAVGYHTFFAQAFLTSILNLRLGVWLANPREDDRDEQGVFWPRYMLREVFDRTNECGALVNLSDGGHTGDNVGIYPLLERGCQVIIACDAEADPKLSFGSFTEALRQAYVDLGVDVDIDLSMIRPDPKTGLSRSHCAVGRIRYPNREDQPSWLIYLKSSLTGDEPAPVLNYRSTSPAFPHETTADQFFDDAQFESYRSLGVHIAEEAFANWAVEMNLKAGLPVWTDTKPESGKAHRAGARHRDDVWQELVYRHTPFRPAEVDDFQRLMQQSSALERLFLETPRLERYYCECMGRPVEGYSSDADASRHVAAMQLQLMQDVFYSLHLDQYANAPDNRGWMNTFRRWGSSPAFTTHVEELRDTFTKAFIAFYDHYIKGWKVDCPVPHRWDRRLKESGGARYEGLTGAALDQCRKSNGPGVFLDPGRREAAGAPDMEPSEETQKDQQGESGTLDEKRPQEAPAASAADTSDAAMLDNPNR